MILGQDPYHNNGQAHGLSFSVQKGVDIPPSLVNIYKELHDDLGCTIPNHGCLTKWAEQGVLMLNTVLTVRAHQANSHRGIGWEEFTDAAILALNSQDSCTEEEENAYESKASYPGSTSSKPAGCLQRFLWKQAI